MDYVRDRLGLPPFVPGRREKAHKDRRSPEERLAEAIASWQSMAADHRADDRKAARLWNEAIDPTDTPAEAYLIRRHLTLPGDMAGRTVRFHPACPRGDERLPALLVRFAPIVHPSETVPWGEDPPVTCVQRIFLDPGKPKGHDGKWLMGHPFDLPKPFLLDGRSVVPPSGRVLAMKLYRRRGGRAAACTLPRASRPAWPPCISVSGRCGPSIRRKAIELFPIFGGI